MVLTESVRARFVKAEESTDLRIPITGSQQLTIYIDISAYGWEKMVSVRKSAKLRISTGPKPCGFTIAKGQFSKSSGKIGESLRIGCKTLPKTVFSIATFSISYKKKFHNFTTSLISKNSLYMCSIQHSQYGYFIRNPSGHCVASL